MTNPDSHKIWAFVPAGGAGARIAADRPKQYLDLAGKPIILHTLERLLACYEVSGVMVGISGKDGFWADVRPNHPKLLPDSVAGEERVHTVMNGLEALLEFAGQNDWVMIHDAARPLVQPYDLDRLINCGCRSESGAILAMPMVDTIKQQDAFGNIAITRDRSILWRAATPQMFRVGPLLKALHSAVDQGVTVTDESSAMELAGCSPLPVTCDSTNFKITTPEDLAMARLIMQPTPLMKIGHGFDAHRLADGRRLILGGVEIPHDRGLQGHSDADVLLHAICDALLGAAGFGDIGGMFPDNDDAFKGISSLVLLERVVERLGQGGHSVGNVDATLVAQAPRLSPFIPTMRRNIANACQVAEENINIKATTTERMGFEGQKEGMSAHAVAIIHKSLEHPTA